MCAKKVKVQVHSDGGRESSKLCLYGMCSDCLVFQCDDWRFTSAIQASFQEDGRGDTEMTEWH